MAKKSKKKFIQKAIKRPGALTKKAEAAGESVDEYARSHESSPGKTGQQSRFYEKVLKKASHKRRGRQSRRG